MKKFTILLIEDDDIDAKSVERAFKKINIINPLHRCKNGEEGVAWLEENTGSSTLILLDLNMPRMGGIEFLKEIRDRGWKNPVVVLTTSTAESDIFNSYNHYISGYIVKPVESDSFVEAMAAIGHYWSLCEISEEL